MARDRTKHDLTVAFTGLSQAQKLAIIDMLACWKYLGGVGSSRLVSFYADGDGDFHPVIKVDGADPQHFGTPEQIQARWKPDYHGDYVIDYDEVAGILHHQEELAALALGPAENPVPHFYRTRNDFTDRRCSFLGDHRFCLRSADDPVHNYPTADDPRDTDPLCAEKPGTPERAS